MSRFPGMVIVGLAVAAALALWGCAEDGLLLGACGDGSLSPGEQCDDGNQDGGDGCSPFCTLESGTTLLPTLASIQERIFTPKCSACHNPTAIAYFLPLNTETASYESLVLATYSLFCSGLPVDPGHPDDSCLVLKIEGSVQAGGDPMPPFPYPPLSTEEIGAIREWISRGAPR